MPVEQSDDIKVLFVDYVDSSIKNSGSSVRPEKMRKAFENLGYDILALEGEQVSNERKKNIKEFRKQIETFNPSFCYIESPTYPIMRHADRHLLKEIMRMGVPIGYYYRDYYRRFPEQFPRRKSLIGGTKERALDILQFLTDKSICNCDIVYFPTKEAANLFDYNDKRLLPPAGENHLNENKTLGFTGLYIGGIVGHYSIEPLLAAYAELNRMNSEFRLILVCREEEWRSYETPFKNAEWLEVYHLSTDALCECYYRSSVAYLMPNPNMKYNDIAISVKIFSYMSYGLPTIAVRCKSMGDFIENEGLGFCVNAVPSDIAYATSFLLNNPEEYWRMSMRVKESLLSRNLWEHRALQVCVDLTGFSYDRAGSSKIMKSS